MNNNVDSERLRAGASRLGVTLSEPAADSLLRYRDELLRWNEKVNLTAITDPSEVLEKHLIDSLAPLPLLSAGATVLDLGAGAGLPGIPLKVADGSLQITLVDAVAKKVGFIKHVAAVLGLREGVRAVHLRASGDPDREGITRAHFVLARAFMPPETFLPFARPYLAKGGRVISMLGPAEEPAMAEVAAAHGYRLVGFRKYELPFSRAGRALAVFQPV